MKDAAQVLGVLLTETPRYQAPLGIASAKEPPHPLGRPSNDWTEPRYQGAAPLLHWHIAFVGLDSV